MEEEYYMDFEEPIYLCHDCDKFDGDYCEKYGKMPLHFFGRKIYCKHLSRVDWNKFYKMMDEDMRKGIY